MTEDRSRILELCFDNIAEIISLRRDLEIAIDEVDDILKGILTNFGVRDYHHNETLRYLGCEPDTKLNEGEIELSHDDILIVRSRCSEAIDFAKDWLLPYFKTKK